MKRHSPTSALLLTLPCVFVLLAGFGIARWREAERKARIAFYSHPSKPQLQLGRGKVPGYGLPGLFEAQAHCITFGGQGELLRGTLMTVGKNPSREIWNSQRLLEPGTLSTFSSGTASFHGGIAPDGAGPSSEATFGWRFCRMSKDAQNLRLIVEAVAIPIPVAEADLGLSRIHVREATPAQIAAAKQQPGATYFRESIDLNARDDAKHHFSRDAMQQ